LCHSDSSVSIYSEYFNVGGKTITVISGPAIEYTPLNKLLTGDVVVGLDQWPESQDATTRKLTPSDLPIKPNGGLVIIVARAVLLGEA